MWQHMAAPPLTFWIMVLPILSILELHSPSNKTHMTTLPHKILESGTASTLYSGAAIPPRDTKPMRQQPHLTTTMLICLYDREACTPLPTLAAKLIS